MKTFHYLSSLVAGFVLSMLVFACDGLQTFSDEEIEEMEQIALDKIKAMKLLLEDSVASDMDSLSIGIQSLSNYWPTEEEIAEGMKWWKDRDGTLPAVYEYQLSFDTSPRGDNPDNCMYYMNVIWNCYPPISQSTWQDYNRMQVQYRKTKSDKWKYLGEEAPGDYDYGIVTVTGFQNPLSINAMHLPSGAVQIRYRLLHSDFPGKADMDTDDIEKRYDKSLATTWCPVYYNQPTYINPYGYDSEDLEQLESIKFIISLPSDLSSGWSFSITVNVDGYILPLKPVSAVTYEGVAPKFKKQGGEFQIAVVGTNKNTGEYKTAYRGGPYDDRTSKEVYIRFTATEFTLYNDSTTIEKP